MSDFNYWQRQIAEYDKEFKDWQGRVDKIVNRYIDDANKKGFSSYKGTKFNILWSNVQLMMPAVFSRLPKPDVSRRFGDSDPVGRVAAMILERALDYEVTYYDDYRAALENCITDWLLGGRGVCWIRYAPKFQALQVGTNPDGEGVTEDQSPERDPEASEYQGPDGQPAEAIDYESSPVDYVHWRDFGHTIARTWEEVTAVWRKCYMDRAALKERFPKIGDTIPLDTIPEDLKKSSLASESGYQAIIYEIWDKATSKVMWYSKSLGKIIEEIDDPLGLEGFWPCVKPLFSTITTSSLIPTPDFAMYQDQARALDELCDRIHGLVRALRIRGVYDASAPALARLFTEGDNNTLIPVDSWMAFAEKSGLKGSIDLVDIAPIAKALNDCYAAFEQQKQQVYEITGLSDIIRGQSDPRETLGAQELKGQFGSLRLRRRQDEVARFATAILKVKAEIICSHYQPETIRLIAGANSFNQMDLPYIDQAIQLLKNEPARNFRIEVAADSLVQVNEQQEKADRTEFLGAVSTYIKDVMPMAAQVPEMAPLLLEMLKFGVTGFKVGKSLEGLVDQLTETVKQQASQEKPEKPDPEQMKLQAEQQKAQMLAQNDMIKHQNEMQMRQTEQQNQAVIQQQENEAQQRRDSQKAQLDMAERQHETELKMQLEMQKLEFEKYKFEEEMKLKAMMHQAERQDRQEEAAENATV